METCRTCAKCDFDNESQWMDLYNSPQWAQETKRIHTELNLWKIKISCTDGLPQKICTDCYTKFCTVSAFRVQCLDAQQILSNIFDKIDTQSLQDDGVFEEFQQASEEDNELLTSTIETTPTASITTNLMTTTLHLTSSTSTSSSVSVSSSSSSTCAISAIAPTMVIESSLLQSNANASENETNTPAPATVAEIAAATTTTLTMPSTTTTTPPPPTTTTITTRNDIVYNINNGTNNTEVSFKSVQPDSEASKIQTDTAVLENDKRNCCNADILIDNSNLKTSIANTNSDNTNEILTEDTNDLDENDLIEEIIDELDIIEEFNNYNEDEADVDVDVDADGDAGLGAEADAEATADDNDNDNDNYNVVDENEKENEDENVNENHNEDVNGGDDDVLPQQYHDQNENNIYACCETQHKYDVTAIASTFATSPVQIDDNDVDAMANNLNITFECRYCYKWKNNATEAFQTQQQLLAHITQLHCSEQPYNCPYCVETFMDAASRTTHLKEFHSQKLHSCDTCGKKYADKFNLRNHVEKYHSGTDFDCALCAKSFCSSKSLNYHMKWHNPKEQLKCSYCDRLFINQRHLKCHEETHTGFRSQEVCSFCGKYFYHLKTLRWHIFRQHGGEKPYKCGRCTEVFTSYFEKRLHMLQYHLDNLTLIEKTECMLCHKRYDNEHVLKCHMLDDHKENKGTVKIANNKRIITNKKPKSFTGLFHCEKCDKRFNMKSALERHQAVHSTEGRPHACPQCPKRFKRSQDMKWHLKTHSSEKPNICDVCGKGFALKYVLTQHRRSHEVLEKNFTCSTCGRSYLFEKSLRLHERIHSGKTYYKCDLCSESFVTHIKLKWHMKKMHDEDEVAATTHRLTPKHINNAELPYAEDLVNIVIT